jgi:hypothetical protein
LLSAIRLSARASDAATASGTDAFASRSPCATSPLTRCRAAILSNRCQSVADCVFSATAACFSGDGGHRQQAATSANSAGKSLLLTIFSAKALAKAGFLARAEDRRLTVAGQTP